MNVGDNIRRLRKDRELTQETLAEQAGISRPMLTQIERGTRNPSLQVSKALADILECKLDDLL